MSVEKIGNLISSACDLRDHLQELFGMHMLALSMIVFADCTTGLFLFLTSNNQLPPGYAFNLITWNNLLFAKMYVMTKVAQNIYSDVSNFSYN